MIDILYSVFLFFVFILSVYFYKYFVSAFLYMSGNMGRDLQAIYEEQQKFPDTPKKELQAYKIYKNNSDHSAGSFCAIFGIILIIGALWVFMNLQRGLYPSPYQLQINIAIIFVLTGMVFLFLSRYFFAKIRKRSEN